jgi:hypothetical protein
LLSAALGEVLDPPPPPVVVAPRPAPRMSRGLWVASAVAFALVRLLVSLLHESPGPSSYHLPSYVPPRYAFLVDAGVMSADGGFAMLPGTQLDDLWSRVIHTGERVADHARFTMSSDGGRSRRIDYGAVIQEVEAVTRAATNSKCDESRAAMKRLDERFSAATGTDRDEIGRVEVEGFARALRAYCLEVEKVTVPLDVGRAKDPAKR